MIREDEKALANRLQLGPRVHAAHLHRGVVVKDMVAQFFQWRLGICRSELSSVFNLLPHRHVDLLKTTQEGQRSSGCLTPPSERQAVETLAL